MATYVNDLRLKEIATGDESGTWGTSTNTNLELIAEAFSFGTEAITTNADTHTTTIADGSTDPGRSLYLKYTGTLDSACTITLGPNTVSKLWFIENGTSGSQNIIISQGSGANVTIPNGHVKAVYSDGAGSGAAIVDAFTDLNVAGVFTSDGGIAVDNITIDGTEIDLSSGDLTIDVAGDIILDAAGDNWLFKKSGTTLLNIQKDGDNVEFISSISDGDMKFRGNDGGSTINALTLDMSDAGTAQFNKEIDLLQSNHLRWKHAAGGTIRASIDADSSDNLMFYTGSSETERVRIDGSGRLLIGADSGDAFNDDAMLRLQRTGDRVFQSFKVDADQEAAIFFGDVDDDVECGIQYQASNKNLILSTGNNSEAMRIDSSGNVGIGETSPLGILHVKDGESSAPTPNESANTLVLEEDDNCGLSIFSGNNDNGMIAFGDAQDSDRGNILYDHNADSLSFTVAAATTMVLSSAQLVSMTHVASAHTGGLTLINSQAGGFGSALTFESERSDNNVLVDAARIRSEGANSWNSDSTTESALIFETCNNNSLSEAMRIRNDGTVVINTTTNQGVGGLTFGVGSNGITATNNTTTGAGNGHEFYVFRRNSTQIGSIVMSNTDGTTYSTSSDARLKNVLGEAKGLEIVNKLNPVNFEWKESKNVQDGLIAQEVQELIPHAVAVSEEGHYSMDYSQVVTPLIKAIQEQQAQIDALQSEINLLKGE
jgi:hypothetical protein